MTDPMEAIPQACAAGDDAAIAAAFRLVKKSKSELILAWSLLEKFATRGARSTLAGPKLIEREVRQVGPVVAWRDRAVKSARETSSGTIKLHVSDTRDAANAFIAAELGAQGFVWGTRAPEGEPQTTSEHREARTRLIAASDAAALVEYLVRYASTSILQYGKDRVTMVGPAWSAADLPAQLVTERASVDIARAVVQHLGSVSAYAVWLAIQQGADALAAVFVPALESGVDDVVPPLTETLLAWAVRHRCAASCDALLAKGASPDACGASVGGDRDGSGPMINAVRNADVATLRKLLAAGGRASAPTASGRTVRDLASALGDADVIAAL